MPSVALRESRMMNESSEISPRKLGYVLSVEDVMLLTTKFWRVSGEAFSKPVWKAVMGVASSGPTIPSSGDRTSSQAFSGADSGQVDCLRKSSRTCAGVSIC